jgi:hypothetical protein
MAYVKGDGLEIKYFGWRGGVRGLKTPQRQDTRKIQNLIQGFGM